MLLDSGIVTVCILSADGTKGAEPKETLHPKSSHYYGERTVGYGRQYAAKGVKERVDMLIRVWQDRSIRIDMHAVLENNEQYKIGNVQHLTDEDGLLVTDMSLERVDKPYAIDGDT